MKFLGTVIAFLFALTAAIAENPLNCSPSGINGGSIAFQGSYNPTTSNIITSSQSAFSTDGNHQVEYVWLKSAVNVPNTVGNPYWSLVPGSQNQAELSVSGLVQTTYFIRCARLVGCTDRYWGETNIVGVAVDLCNASFIHGGSIAFSGSYNPLQTNTITNAQSATSDFGTGVSIEYIWLKSLVNVPNTAGNPYWSVVPDSQNKLQLEISGLTQTTYYIRCARVQGCQFYWGETPTVTVPVDVCSANYIHGGSISFDGSYNPNQTNVIHNAQSATSDFGAGVNIEYIWLKSLVNVPNTTGNPHWSVVPDSQNKLQLEISGLTQTTYYIRCARVQGCQFYWGETPTVTVPVDVCSANYIHGGSISFEGSYNPNQANIINNAQSATSDFGTGVNIEYIWLKSLVNVPNTVGNTNWSVVPDSQNKLQLEISGLTQTTYYIRCARVQGCQFYWGETPTVTVPVDVCSANYIHGGSISFEGSYNPNQTNIIHNVQSATSDFGAGVNIEYIWLKSLVNVPNTVGNTNWSVVPDSQNKLQLEISGLTQTSYYIRCARVQGCQFYWGETPTVTVPVDACSANYIHGGSISFEGSYNPNQTNIIHNAQSATSDFGAGVTIEYIWLKSLVNVPNTTGNPHWSVVPDSQNKLQLEISGLTQTTYYVRCARVEGCQFYWGETPTVTVPVDVCNSNYIHGGSISFEGSYNPNQTNTVQNTEAASSDFGEELGIEYIWLKSPVNTPNVVGNPYWKVVEGSQNQLSLAIAGLTNTTYFIRCARVEGCSTYWGETNIVGVTVDLCNASFINSGSIVFEGIYNPNQPNIVQNVEAATSDFSDELEIEYIWLKSPVNTPNVVGNSYWTVVEGSQNQLSLTVTGLTNTTYFIRCARVDGCEIYWGETNIVEVVVDPCLEGTITGGTIAFNGSYNPVGSNTITSTTLPGGPFAGLGFQYIWLQSEVNVPNTAGNTSWSVIPGSENHLEWEVGNLTQTMYYIRCARYTGCDSYWGESNIVEVIGFEIPTAVISGGGQVCGQAGTATVYISLTGVGPFNVTYSDGGTTTTLVVAENSYSFEGGEGTYSLVAVSDANYQATVEGEAIVTTYELPTAVFSGGGTVCNGDEKADLAINLTGAAPWTIVYSVNGQTTEVVSEGSEYKFSGGPGSYQLVSVADNVCSSPASGSVEVSLTPAFDGKIDLKERYCAGEEIVIRVVNGGTYPISWSTSGAAELTIVDNNTVRYQPLSAETSVEFTAQVTTGCGVVELSAQTDIIPVVNTEFTTAANVDNYLTNVNYTFIPSFEEGDNYVWYINDEKVSAEVLDKSFETSGEYTVSLTIEKDGCVYSESMGITVNSNQNLFIPNVFNPNSPNPENNVVKVYAEGVQENSFLFRIYNRWGKLMYETANFNQARNSGWNGYFNGELQANGNYTYTVRGYFSDGQSFEKTGIVSISK